MKVNTIIIIYIRLVVKVICMFYIISFDINHILRVD